VPERGQGLQSNLYKGRRWKELLERKDIFPGRGEGKAGSVRKRGGERKKKQVIAVEKPTNLT